MVVVVVVVVVVVRVLVVCLPFIPLSKSFLYQLSHTNCLPP